jgi:hypothetical protein
LRSEISVVIAAEPISVPIEHEGAPFDLGAYPAAEVPKPEFTLPSTVADQCRQGNIADESLVVRVEKLGNREGRDILIRAQSDHLSASRAAFSLDEIHHDYQPHLSKLAGLF